MAVLPMIVCFVYVLDQELNQKELIMLKTKATLWLFLSSTIFLFVLMPIFSGQLIIISKIFFWLILFVTLIWFLQAISLMMSFGILMKLMNRNHWHTPSFIGTVYWLLTKEARVVADNYYKFNPNQGVSK
jgi:hypothetical protein